MQRILKLFSWNESPEVRLLHRYFVKGFDIYFMVDHTVFQIFNNVYTHQPTMFDFKKWVFTVIY